MAGAFSSAFSSAFDVGGGGGGGPVIPVFIAQYRQRGPMRFLRTNTAVRITVGPFFDKTDGVTPETALTVTSCKLTLMVDDANVPTLVLDTAPTASGGANDMVHVTGDDAGFYDLELAAANVNYLGRAMLAITDAATHCPVFHEFMILPAMIYDSMVLGTDRLDTNVTHVADTSQTAGDIIGDTNDIQSRLPAALSGGKMDSVVPDTQKVDVNTIKTQALTCSAGVTVGAFVGQATAAIGVNASGHVSRVVLVDTITTYTGDTPQTGDSYAIVNSGTHGNAAIKGYVDDIGTAGAGLTAVPWNAAWDAEVQSEVDDALAATVYVRKNTLQSGTTASVVLDASASSETDAYKLCKILITSGSAAGQVQIITAYNGTTKTANVAPSFTTAPGAATYVILPGSYEWAEYFGATGSAALIEDLWQHTDRTITGFTAAGSTAIRTAVGLASANLDTQLTAIDDYLDTEVAAIKTKTDYLPSATAGSAGGLLIAGSNAATTFDTLTVTNAFTVGSSNLATSANVSAVMTTAMTESYNADGSAPTPAQALYAILQRTTEFSIAGTTITVKKLDGSTTAYTLTLDDATSPTSSTRAT